MELLDKLVIAGDFGQQRSLELWYGDLTDMPSSEAVDVLIVSAFPNDYIPVRGTLMGALHNKGIFVEELAQHKLIDKRANLSCWLSQPIQSSSPGIH